MSINLLSPLLYNIVIYICAYLSNLIGIHLIYTPFGESLWSHLSLLYYLLSLLFDYLLMVCYLSIFFYYVLVVYLIIQRGRAPGGRHRVLEYWVVEEDGWSMETSLQTSVAVLCVQNAASST